MMRQAIRTLCLLLAASCALRPLPAQTATVSNTNPYLRMCDGVARPVATDSSKNYRPAATATGTLCWLLRTATAPPPLDTTSTTPPIGTNEPVGMTRLAESRGTCAIRGCPDGWSAYPGYAGALSVGVDSTAPRSRDSVIYQHFTSVLPGGSSPGAFVIEGAAWAQRRVIYVAYWMKLSPNFFGHSTGVNKNVFFIVAANNRIYSMLQGPTGTTGPLRPAIGLQSLPAPYFSSNDGYPVTATSVNLYPNVGSVNVERGRWYKYEVVLDAGFAGSATGSVQMWVDGVKALNYTGIMFAGAGENARWEGVNWGPIWGGQGGTITTSFYASMDHIYVSGK